MNWMDKLERKWGRHAVPNLSRYFVFATAAGWLIRMVAPELMVWFNFSAEKILHGQIWRLVTWIFMPTYAPDIMGIISLLIVILWGSQLEMIIGTFRMNVFLWMGVIVSDIGGILIYLISYLVLHTGIPVDMSTYYLLSSIVLAVALYMPEEELRIWFVLPLKMKWFLCFELVYMGCILIANCRNAIEYVMAGGGATAAGITVGIIFGVVNSASMLLALLSMFLFFHFSSIHITRKHKKRQKEFRAQFHEPRPGSGIAKHKCAVCGRTELTNPELMFRYCSKCKGNMEYCEEHLYEHTHVK